MITRQAKVRFGLPLRCALVLASAWTHLNHCALAQVQASQSVVIQSGPSSAIPPTSEKFTLTGTVVDSTTGEAVSRALVQIYSVQHRTTFTDENGRFQIDGVPRGSYAVTAQKPGYFNEQ